MQIVSANYDQFGNINVVIEDMPEGSSVTVPADPANKDYVELQEWAAQPGNQIAPYVAPGPTPEQARIEALLALPKVASLKTLLATSTGDQIDDWADDNAGSAAELRTAFKSLLKLLAAKL
jgi:hypothetical protein